MQLMHHDHMELLPNTYPRYGASQLKMQEEQLRLQHKHLFKLGSNIIMQLWHQQLHAKIPMYTGLLLYGYILCHKERWMIIPRAYVLPTLHHR